MAIENLDLIKISGGRNIPVEIHINFKVSKNQTLLSVKALPESEIMGYRMDLDFCGQFAVGAFAVIELGSPSPPPDPPSVCPHLQFDKDECFRPFAFYAINGGVCAHLSSEISKGCEADSTIFAVNLNGHNLTDVAGIEYLAEGQVPHQDKNAIRVGASYPEEIEEVPQLDQKLYQDYIYGLRDLDPHGQCITYQFPVKTSGRYELTLRTLEPWFSEAGKRTFNVFLNGVPVLKELDVIRYSVRKGVGVNFIVNFQVLDGGRKMKLKGHSDSFIRGDLMKLALCQGTLSTAHNNFVMSAIHVVKFKPPCVEPPEEEEEEQCPQPLLGEKKFIRTGQNSKYLYPVDVFHVLPQDALEICRKLKLEPAVINSAADYRHLVDDLIFGDEAVVVARIKFNLKVLWFLK